MIWPYTITKENPIFGMGAKGLLKKIAWNSTKEILTFIYLHLAHATLFGISVTTIIWRVNSMLSVLTCANEDQTPNELCRDQKLSKSAFQSRLAIATPKCWTKIMFDVFRDEDIWCKLTTAEQLCRSASISHRGRTPQLFDKKWWPRSMAGLSDEHQPSILARLQPDTIANNFLLPFAPRPLSKTLWEMGFKFKKICFLLQYSK